MPHKGSRIEGDDFVIMPEKGTSRERIEAAKDIAQVVVSVEEHLKKMLGGNFLPSELVRKNLLKEFPQYEEIFGNREMYRQVMQYAAGAGIIDLRAFELNVVMLLRKPAETQQVLQAPLYSGQGATKYPF